jgi:L-serine dehydratase
MLAANQFVQGLKADAVLNRVSRVTTELYGSLGATGKGHGTPKAVLLGFEGELPDLVDVPAIAGRVAAIRDNGRLCLLAEHAINYNHDLDFKLHRRKALAFHPNGMVFAAFDKAGNELNKRTFFSVGGGFVVDESATGADCIVEDSRQLAYDFDSANELLQLCTDQGLSISDVMLENEKAWRSEQETRDGLLHLWSVMQSCVANGIANGGILHFGIYLCSV